MHIHKLQCMYYNTCTYVHVTSARHYVRALNMKHTLEFVFIEHYAMLFCSTYKMAAQTHTVGCEFCIVLSIYKMAACAHAGVRI